MKKTLSSPPRSQAGQAGQAGQVGRAGQVGLAPGSASAAARSRAARLVVVLAGLLALALTVAGCVPPGTGGPAGPGGTTPPGGSGGTATSLADCPTLRSSQRDPVGGKNCVRALQQALRDNGYSAQPVTGSFLDQTKANVADFQRQHGISPDGVVGPQTKAALLAGTPGTKPPTTKPPVTTLPVPKPVGPARLTTCGAIGNGLQCDVYGSGFAPSERVTVVATPDDGGGDGYCKGSADTQGEFLCHFVRLSAPGVTVTVRARGEQSGLTAVASYKIK